MIEPQPREELSEYTPLFKFRRVPYIQDYGAPSLALFATEFGEKVAHDIRGSREGGLGEKKFVLLSGGAPTSGKSHFQEIIERFLDKYFQDVGVKEEVTTNRVTWENDGRLRAFKAGLITQGLDEAWSDQNLNEAEIKLTESVKESIRKYTITYIEAPAFHSVRLATGRILGRSLGFKTLEALALSPQSFNFDIDLNVVGHIPGPLLRYIMAYFRDEINVAQVLAEAQEIAEIFGKKPPRNNKEWGRMKGGANLGQVETADVYQNILFDTLETRGLITIPPIGDYNFDYTEGLRRIITQEQVYSAYRVWGLSGAVIQLILRDNLGIPSQNAFIGYNNPTLEDLNIKDLDRLVNHLDYIRSKQANL